MKTSYPRRERRKSPRFLVDLPLEYRVVNAPYVHGGLVVNASEIGLLIHSVKNMPIGTRLNIVVLFPEGFELNNFEVVAEVIWKDLCLEEDWEGFRYGLKFLHVTEKNRLKLKHVLQAESN